MEQNLSSNEVVVMISGGEEGSTVRKKSGDFIHLGSPSYSFQDQIPVNSPVSKLDSVRNRRQMHSNFSALEITKLSPTSAIMSPGASVTRPRSMKPSTYSRSKSRVVGSSYPTSWKLAEGNVTTSSHGNGSAASIYKDNFKKPPVTPKTPLIGGDYADDGDDNDYDDDVYQAKRLEDEGKEVKKFKYYLVLVEWVVFLCMLVLLTASLTVPKLKSSIIWGVEFWKWCVIVLIMFCGRLCTKWVIDLLVFTIEKNSWYKKKVLYFVYSLKKSIHVFIWLFFVLLAWALLIYEGVDTSKEINKFVNLHITRSLISSLIGSAMWVVKTFFLKLLASHFHVQRFFDRIQEAVFHQYALQTLSGPPLLKDNDMVGVSRASGQMCFKSRMKGKQKEGSIDVVKLQKMRKEKVSAWTMGGLVKVIRSSGLSNLSHVDDDNEGVEQNIKMITDEREAKTAAARIFKHVAQPGHNYIDEEDLLRFVSVKEVDDVLSLFEGAVEEGKISGSSFCNWVVNVYQERKFLTHSLNDSKTAINALNKLVSGIVLVVITFLWLHLMEFMTTKVLFFVSSQLLLYVFIFGSTLKTTFEAIIFIFVVHPFDVGDSCIIDGVQMVVEEMHILTTIFLRSDNEKVYYPNSVLTTKVISNFNRSPKMSDPVEFAIDVSTSAELIEALTARIKAYLGSKPEKWRREHSLQIKEIDNMNKIRMTLNVSGTMNFQNHGETSNRRSELLFELKKIFEGLGIKYYLPPKQVHTN